MSVCIYVLLYCEYLGKCSNKDVELVWLSVRKALSFPYILCTYGGGIFDTECGLVNSNYNLN